MKIWVARDENEKFGFITLARRKKDIIQDIVQGDKEFTLPDHADGYRWRPDYLARFFGIKLYPGEGPIKLKITVERA